MTNQEIIDVLVNEEGCALGTHYGCDHDCDFCVYKNDDKRSVAEAYDAAVEALQNKSEAEEYRSPMKMRFDWWTTAGGADYTLVCPRCGKEPECDDFCKRLPFCAYCGQALDWDWQEEEGNGSQREL